MKKSFFTLLLIAISLLANAQVMSNSTARYYLNESQTFTQADFNSFNTSAGYQLKLPIDSTQSTAMILKYPSLDSVQVYWANGVWNTSSPTAITTNFTTMLMVNYPSIAHTASSMIPGVNSSTVLVDWGDVPGATQYRFRIRPINTLTWITSTITGSQRNMTTLTPSTTYEVQLRVYLSSSIQGEYSQIYSFTTPAFIPLPPCNPPTVTAIKTNDSLKLSWSAVPNGVGYQVQVRMLGSLGWGGTTISGTSYNISAASNTAYEYQLRTSCTNASSAWSAFTSTDTVTDAVCTPPTNLYNVGNTFYWTNNKYATLTQIQTRLVGNVNWGGTSTSSSQYTFKYLWGRHEWRVRSICYATTNTSWTDWSYGLTGFIPNPNSFDEFTTSVPYPNPANDILHYNGKIVLKDLFGRVVAEGENEIDVQHLSNGIYLLDGNKIVINH